MNETILRSGITIESIGNYDGVIVAGIDDKGNGFVLKLPLWEVYKLNKFLSIVLENRENFLKSLEQESNNDSK